MAQKLHYVMGRLHACISDQVRNARQLEVDQILQREHGNKLSHARMARTTSHSNSIQWEHSRD
jgi:hypothetical protein